ncbi:phytanoyl-CoA dioxygenase family protein [Pedobacter glucosidilyticus]|uniref:phytanoyl-CoA dioxygenase family protein n=1 Tax=Pedobacter glucosidilyticus TaxID=1122941 RepID=UPI0026EE9419|nr:phytanoyl-CoA dioxygenase family protein [Pedobacter glucosidilyticus]
MMKNQLSDDQKKAYLEDGFLIIRSFLNTQEVNKIYQATVQDEAITNNSYELKDKSGKNTKLALWFTPGDDVFGLLTKSKRMINAVNFLLDGDAPVCHFHSKLMQKEPKVGGAWEWHQDYGYWYRNEFLYPDQMISVMTAITESTVENGCLQVIKGSHKIGRIEHGFSGEQVGASQHYVDLALKTMELVYVTLKPGDVLFFHSNLLHRSEANLSDNARWSLISCYNRQTNIPYNEKSKSCITPISPVQDEALLEAEIKSLNEMTDFSSKKVDESLKG